MTEYSRRDEMAASAIAVEVQAFGHCKSEPRGVSLGPAVRSTLKRENCLVIGLANKVTEVVIAALFEATAFDAAEIDKDRIPFHFVVPRDHPSYRKKSGLISPARDGEDVGLFFKRDRRIIPAYWEPDQDRFFASEKDGTDVALVVVANRPLGTTNEVKCIVLAGFTGTGTVGAARAVIRDFRILEPIGTAPAVGILRISYLKHAGSDRRDLLSHDWEYLNGGVTTIDRLKRKA